MKNPSTNEFRGRNCTPVGSETTQSENFIVDLRKNFDIFGTIDKHALEDTSAFDFIPPNRFNVESIAADFNNRLQAQGGVGSMVYKPLPGYFQLSSSTNMSHMMTG